jgi:glutamine---fructose-6-phosphate transaminase (isomerizing)
VSGCPAEGRGSHFRREIREQPNALRQLIGDRAALEDAARAIRRRSPALIRIVAHGSSDNAASYGVYAFGVLAGLTAFRDSMSLAAYYGVDQDFGRSVVIALSQSGRTPDVVAHVERARSRGALTIALTNDPGSELGQAANLVVPLAAGSEHAVPATKTYTNQLAALALLAALAGGRERETIDGLRRTAELQEGSLEHLERAVAPLAAPFAFVGRMFVIGRGIEFATAREIALKLTETCRIAAEPLTATDLAHGPVAALDPLSRCGSSRRAMGRLRPSSKRAREPVPSARPSSRAGKRRARSRAPRSSFPCRPRPRRSSDRSSRCFPDSCSQRPWRRRKAWTSILRPGSRK